MTDSLDPTRCRVALLAGGTSGEREISLASGDGAQLALEEAGFQVTRIDPAEKEDLTRLIEEDFDVAFLCLHGEKGEDGAIQGFLELIDLPYTGAGICASALAIDKGKAKIFYSLAHINTPDSVNLNEEEPFDIDEVVSITGEHCVVKPATEGSSLGVYICEGKAEIEKALSEVFAYGKTALVERYVKGIELTVAVLGTEEPRALPIIEIIPQAATYDFDSKYKPGGSQHICPARLSEATSAEIKELAVRAHKALCCEGMSRSDFILDEDGESWILETNTIPGMTGTSLLPDAAKAAGISFPVLCTQLVNEALAAAAAKK